MSMNKQTGLSASMNGALRTILLAGGAAGIFDLVFTSGGKLVAGNSPLDPWKGVASGLLGPAAREGGIEMALLGVGLHFFICIAAAALLYAVLKRWPWYGEHPLETSILFGIGFLLAMNWVIVPLSRIGSVIYPTDSLHVTAFWHIVLVGLPTTLVISHDLAARRSLAGVVRAP